MEILTFLGILFALGLFVKILKNKDKPIEDYANTPENRRKARQDLFFKQREYGWRLASGLAVPTLFRFKPDNFFIKPILYRLDGDCINA